MEAEISPRAPLQDYDFWSQGLDRAFFGHVYIRATQIGVVAALLFLAFEQKTVAAGILCGMAVGLFSLWTVEATVRLLMNGGRHAGWKLAVGACIKLPFMLVGLVSIAWASYHKYMNIFGVVGGVVIVHLTMLIMVIATAMAHQDGNRERYR